MERIKHLRKPNFLLEKDKPIEYLKARYDAVVRETQEKTNQIATLQELEGKIEDLLEKKMNAETELSESMGKLALWNENDDRFSTNIQKIKEEKVAFNRNINMLLMKKKEAELNMEYVYTDIKRTNEALLKAAMHYKRKLDIRVKFDEEENIYVHFLDICTSDGSACCIKLSYKDKKWGLLDLMPQLTCKNKLAKHLEETEDIQGFLAHVRKLFMIKVQSAN